MLVGWGRGWMRMDGGGVDGGVGVRKGRRGSLRMLMKREGKKARMKIAKKRMLVESDVEEGIKR